MGRSYNVMSQRLYQQYQEGILHIRRKIGLVICFLQELTILYVSSVVSLKVQGTKTKPTIMKCYLQQVSRFHILKNYHHIHLGYFWRGTLAFQIPFISCPVVHNVDLCIIKVLTLILLWLEAWIINPLLVRRQIVLFLLLF